MKERYLTHSAFCHKLILILVSLDSLGGEHSASGGENLWLSGLHEVAGKQTWFIPIREH
jgi:hypothetical protein